MGGLFIISHGTCKYLVPKIMVNENNLRSNELLYLVLVPVKALYPVATSPNQFDYISYIYLLAPVSLAIINPIGFTFMELNKNLSSKKMDMKQVRQSRAYIASFPRLPVLAGSTWGPTHLIKRELGD